MEVVPGTWSSMLVTKTKCYDSLIRVLQLVVRTSHIRLGRSQFLQWHLWITVSLVTRRRMRMRSCIDCFPSSLNTGMQLKVLQLVTYFTWHGSPEHDKSGIAPLSACPSQLQGISQHWLRFHELYFHLTRRPCPASCVWAALQALASIQRVECWSGAVQSGVVSKLQLLTMDAKSDEKTVGLTVSPVESEVNTDLLRFRCGFLPLSPSMCAFHFSIS